MFSRIGFTGGAPIGRINSRSSAHTTPDSAKAGTQNYDSVSFSDVAAGQELRTKDLAAQISGQIRIRPTSGEIQELSHRVQEGTYQPDPGEIAARMLLINKED